QALLLVGPGRPGSEGDDTVAHFDVVGRHVVGPQIEGAARAQVEAGMVPVTGEDAIVDAALVQGKAKVRTAIVDGEDAALVSEDGDGTIGPAHDEDAFAL